MNSFELRTYENIPGIAGKVVEARLAKYDVIAITNDTIVLKREPVSDRMVTFDNADSPLQRKKLLEAIEQLLNPSPPSELERE